MSYGSGYRKGYKKKYGNRYSGGRYSGEYGGYKKREYPSQGYKSQKKQVTYIAVKEEHPIRIKQNKKYGEEIVIDAKDYVIFIPVERVKTLLQEQTAHTEAPQQTVQEAQTTKGPITTDLEEKVNQLTEAVNKLKSEVTAIKTDVEQLKYVVTERLAISNTTKNMKNRGEGNPLPPPVPQGA